MAGICSFTGRTGTGVAVGAGTGVVEAVVLVDEGAEVTAAVEPEEAVLTVILDESTLVVVMAVVAT
ncbi:MAG: hypothetical protein M1296_04670 [Chloroflexi bacterium]|nr:hypothetical protein [Chloroflexota bacterium]